MLHLHIFYSATASNTREQCYLHPPDDDCIKQRVAHCLLGVALDPVINDIVTQETETILSIPANMVMNICVKAMNDGDESTENFEH